MFYCLVKEVLTSRHFKVPVSDIYIDEQCDLAAVWRSPCLTPNSLRKRYTP